MLRPREHSHSKNDVKIITMEDATLHMYHVNVWVAAFCYMDLGRWWARTSSRRPLQKVFTPFPASSLASELMTSGVRTLAHILGKT